MNPSRVIRNPEPPPCPRSLLPTRMLTTLGATRLTTAAIVCEYESSRWSSLLGLSEVPVGGAELAAVPGAVFVWLRRVDVMIAASPGKIFAHVNVGSVRPVLPDG